MSATFGKGVSIMYNPPKHLPHDEKRLKDAVESYLTLVSLVDHLLIIVCTQAFMLIVRTIVQHSPGNEDSMARQSGGKQGNWNFVNLRMTEAERKQFEGWLVEYGDDMVDLLADILAQGYKLTMRWDFTGHCVITTLVGNEDTRINNGSSLTSRHDTVNDSLMLTLFKHSVICQNSTWRDDTSETTWG